jgi:hypothetical protein
MFSKSSVAMGIKMVDMIDRRAEGRGEMMGKRRCGVLSIGLERKKGKALKESRTDIQIAPESGRWS